MSVAETPEREAASKPVLTPNEFWLETGKTIGRNSLYGLIQMGRLKHVKIGRKILIPRSELTDFFKREAGAA